MDNPNLFTKEESQKLIDRINQLSPETQAKWGKMDVARMLAHCNVSYETIYTDKHPRPTGLKRLMINLFAKNVVTNAKPYKKNSMTAPMFIIADKKVFDEEKERLVNYISKTQELGEAHFDGKENLSFGPLSKNQWNNLMYKHLNHHLEQFGV